MSLSSGTKLGPYDVPALRESLVHFFLLLMKNGDLCAVSKPLVRAAAAKTTDPDLLLPCGLFTPGRG